ncbi:MAG: bifunctional oligoribonuclease/PAP phosphatase NrnA [Lachnospiraceae bacterium]|jgi:phosphoesterase RecJ-like protein|nr:bifunctional oligoribonuclease/PAP phosphatase NrnA [Lachnospiraceae bacterium]
MINLKDVLKDAQTIGISGHVHPDGDCIGATLGLYNYIKDNYPMKNVRLFLEEIPDVFNFLHRSEEIVHGTTDDAFDLYFVMDCSDELRLGDYAKHLQNTTHTVCVDHHKSNKLDTEYAYVVPDASSTSELVYNLLPKEAVTKEIAECLYTGIVHDTGVFQYSCTAKSTMEAAGFFMEKGIDYSSIVERTYFEKTFAQNRILARAVLRANLWHDGEIIISYLTREEMAEFDATPQDLDGIVNQLRITKGVEVAVFLYETGDGEFKASLRSKSRVDVSEIALKFGGGGHLRAAGATMKGEAEEILTMLLPEITKRLEKGND